MAYHLAGTVMLGGLIEWFKSYTSVPSLLASYVECNGQSLSDTQSIFNGLTIPNLNGSGGGTQRFLRGSTTSGTTGGAATHTHTATNTAGNVALGVCALFCPRYNIDSQSNNPPFYENVVCMRIK